MLWIVGSEGERFQVEVERAKLYNLHRMLMEWIHILGQSHRVAYLYRVQVSFNLDHLAVCQVQSLVFELGKLFAPAEFINQKERVFEMLSSWVCKVE